MLRKIFFILSFIFALSLDYSFSQNFTFNYNSNGNRVCLVESVVDLSIPNVTIKLLDYADNSNHSTTIYRRSIYSTGADWTLVASSLPAGTQEWIDTNVELGDVWEYQIKRQNTWLYNAQTYDAVGYTIGSVLKDNTSYHGQIILLVANDIVEGLPNKYLRLKKELTGEGWFVNEVFVPKASSWYSGDTIVEIKNKLISIYNNAPQTDKPKALFILGHVPMPRSGSTFVTAPDAHDQNKGARGFDGYYADIDGIYTDTATFNPGGLQLPEAINLPGDYKWDQDFFSSDIEMAFGRVDFFDIDDYSLTEIELIEIYLDKLSNYRNVNSGFEMGEKSGFSNGYNNSNDGSFRTLTSISKSTNVYENTTGSGHPQWVQNNGPFKIYMQNQNVPEIAEWNSYGMNATVFTSDQSYWGYNDCPQSGYVYSRIRALLGSNSKCLVTLWTTTTVNTFYQSCTGDPLSFAIREKIKHNTTNNNIETPQSQWDEEAWWNRTHLTYNGDPTIRLYQVKAPSNLSISKINGNAKLSWNASADSSILGYNIYKSNTEFGIYQKINSTIVLSLEYADIDYQQNDWYMVRAIKKMESGCGQFIQASLGIFKQGDFILSVNETSLENEIDVYPNPASKIITVSSDKEINSLQLLTFDGRIVLEQKNVNSSKFNIDISKENEGVYYLLIQTNDAIAKRKFVIIK